jgi:hypothetical protein
MIKVSSGIISASQIIFTGKCLYYGFTALPGGSDRTVVLYDALSATGTAIENFVADANKPTDGHSHSNPVLCATGIYAAISGGSIVVFYLDFKEYYKQIPDKLVGFSYNLVMIPTERKCSQCGSRKQSPHPDNWFWDFCGDCGNVYPRPKTMAMVRNGEDFESEPENKVIDWRDHILFLLPKRFRGMIVEEEAGE